MQTTETPFLVTLGFDPSTFERIDRLRSRYFPADLNVVAAHLSLFHQLPGEAGDSIDRILANAAQTSGPIFLVFASLKKTGRGMMVSVEAPALVALRANLARSFTRWLTPQDRQPFHPHVTIMNKADRTRADTAFCELQAVWFRSTGIGDRLILWRYLGGPWGEVTSYALKGQAVGQTSMSSCSPSEG